MPLQYVSLAWVWPFIPAEICNLVWVKVTAIDVRLLLKNDRNFITVNPLLLASLKVSEFELQLRWHQLANLNKSS